MRVLLTGGTGFIGSHIAWNLAHAGHEVTMLVRDPARVPFGLRKLGLRFAVGDLLAIPDFSGLLAGQESVVHAALVWSDDSARDFDDLEVTKRLIDAGRLLGLPFAYLSSAAVHRPFLPLMDEAAPLSPPDSYGQVKALAEGYLSKAGLDRWLVLRPGPVVGGQACDGGAVRVPRAVSEIIEAAKSGGRLRFAESEGRQLTSVRSLALTVEMFLRGCAPSGPYLVMDSEPTQWSSLASRLGNASVEFSATPSEPPHRFSTAKWESAFGIDPSSRPDLEELVAWISAGG